MLAFGLYSHIRANHMRTTLLMLCFISTVAMIYFSICLVREVFDLPSSVSELFTDALDRFVNESPWLAIGFGLWFIIMVLYHHKILDAATGAKNITRADEPKLYAMVEALCISRGMNVPQLKIIESDALNACAAGLVEDDHSISVTRGLLSTLTSEELETVLAHELTHIHNRDAQMMVVTTIFVGFIGIIGSIIMHHWDIMLREALRKAGRDSEERPGILPIVIGIFTAVLIAAMSLGLSLLIRLAISRKREYLAHTGAVELTKNPDALIRALRKIEGWQRLPKRRALSSLKRQRREERAAGLQPILQLMSVLPLWSTLQAAMMCRGCLPQLRPSAWSGVFNRRCRHPSSARHIRNCYAHACPWHQDQQHPWQKAMAESVRDWGDFRAQMARADPNGQCHPGVLLRSPDAPIRRMSSPSLELANPYDDRVGSAHKDYASCCLSQ